MISRRSVLRSLAAGASLTLVKPADLISADIPLPQGQPVVPAIADAGNNGAWACWIGHATVLIRMAGKWILTDPVLFDAYGVNILGVTIGPRRYAPPALSIDQLPRPDLILISHAHMDHMDRKTLAAFGSRYPNEIDVITATNTKDVIEDLPWKSLNEMDWGDRVQIDGLQLTALQVQHNGWRMPGEPCRGAGQHRTGRSFNGYHLESSVSSIVFGGDTAYCKMFGSIRSGVDLAIMPIGAYRNCPDVHCTPEEAFAMVQMMKARRMLPIHHGTFNQQCEPSREPLKRLIAAMSGDHREILAGRHIGDAVNLA